MAKLAQIVTSSGGPVLEVGFGMGIAARRIQEKQPEYHIIIECHPDVIGLALRIFRPQIGKGRISLVSGFWEDVIYRFAGGQFDGILFDTGPIDREVRFFHFYPFFKEAHRLLNKGGVFTYFSDEPERLSDEHIRMLRDAGFSDISWEVRHVKPVKECRYWRHDTIVAPIVIK